MTTLCRPSLSTHVDAVRAGLDLATHPYLAALDGGAMSRTAFVTTQIQFAHAVDGFPGAMALVVAGIPVASQRVEIVRNLWEEHGEGDLSRAHGATIRAFLRSLGFDRPTLEPEGPSVQEFLLTVRGMATSPDHRLGVAAFGMIEHVFQQVSARVGRAVVARGWLNEEDVVHYDTHEKLDVRHAADFFDVVREDWGAPVHHATISAGIVAGARALDQLYRGLWDEVR